MSGNVPARTGSKRVFISMPKEYITGLAAHYELDHGLIVKGLNPYINEGYLRAHFKEWGTITACRIRKNASSGENNAIAYVRFSSEHEADSAEWAGPHDIGGIQAVVRRVVSPKIEEVTAEVVTAKDDTSARSRRHMGRGYILEDAQWLDDNLEE